MKVSFDAEKCIDSDKFYGEFVLQGIRKDTAAIINREFNGKKVRVSLEVIE
jgi:hypothetical protein